MWFAPDFLPTADQPADILFLNELTAADQHLQRSACSLILDRWVGRYGLPDGWRVVAAGNASFHGAVSHDMGTALADRMFQFNVQTVIVAFLAHGVAMGFAPEVMACLKVRPDRLDDTAAQLANDHLVGASPRGWEDVSRVLQSGVSGPVRRRLVQGRIGAAHAAEFFGVLQNLQNLQAAVDVLRLLAARPGAETAALLPRTFDGLFGMLSGLLAASVDAASLARALDIIEQWPDRRGNTPQPVREAQTLAMELLLQRAGARPGDPGAGQPGIPAPCPAP